VWALEEEDGGDEGPAMEWLGAAEWEWDAWPVALLRPGDFGTLPPSLSMLDMLIIGRGAGGGESETCLPLVP
jgi:hypothetical protein